MLMSYFFILNTVTVETLLVFNVVALLHYMEYMIIDKLINYRGRRVSVSELTSLHSVSPRGGRRRSVSMC